jgi:hypothetical protein
MVARAATVLWCREGGSDGSGSSCQVGWHSPICARERKGCEEGCPQWAVVARTEELTVAVTGADRRAMGGGDKMQGGGPFIAALHEAKWGYTGGVSAWHDT